MKLNISPVAAFVGCLTIWGTTWIVIREGAAGLPPLGSAGLRTAIAAALLVVLALAFRAPWPDARGVVSAALVGLFLFAGNLGFIYLAEERLTSSMTVMLYATFPLQVALMAPMLVPGERFSARRAAGAAIGLVGVAISVGGLRALDATLLGPAAFAILAATMAGVGTCLARRGRGVDPLWMNAIGNLSATGALAIASVFMEGRSPIPQTGGAWLALVYLAVVGSVGAFVLYAQLLRSWPAARASYVSIGAYLVAIVIGVGVAREPITSAFLAGGAAILAGAALALAPARAPRQAPTQAFSQEEA